MGQKFFDMHESSRLNMSFKCSGAFNIIYIMRTNDKDGGNWRSRCCHWPVSLFISSLVSLFITFLLKRSKATEKIIIGNPAGAFGKVVDGLNV